MLTKLGIKKTRSIEAQLAQYVAWRQRTYPTTAEREERWVRHFSEWAKCDDVCTVVKSTAKAYDEYLRQEYGTTYARECALKAMGNFTAYWHSRGWPCVGRSAWRTPQ